MAVETSVDFFSILEEYKDQGAPKTLKDLPAFEQACRKEGKIILADWLEEWRLNLEFRMSYHIKKEFSE